MKNILFTIVAVLGMSTMQAQTSTTMEIDMDMSMDMPSQSAELNVDITPGLITLGTTGSAKDWAMEDMNMRTYKGKITGATYASGPFLKALNMEEMSMNAGFFGFAPEIGIQGDFIFRMVAPSVHPDNFVVLHKPTGVVLRFDLGQDEGTNVVTLVGQYE